MIFGDFNARTASEQDYIENDSPKCLPLFDSYKNDDTVRVRNSNDVVLDTRGKELFELCISNELRIVNGRCIGDIFGNFTCFNPLGQSTVDFLLTSESIFAQILYFKVSNFIPFLSDCHCKISWEILAKYKDNYSNKTNTSTSKFPLKYMYIWTNDAGVKFQEALNSPTMQDKIKMFLENSKSYTANDILKAVSDVENIILSAANMSLSKPKQKKNKKNKNKNGLTMI